MDGYKEAAKIDRLIQGVFDNNPITVESSRNWLNLIRTIRTTCDLLEHKTLKVLRVPSATHD